KKRKIYDQFGEEGLKSGAGGNPGYNFENSDVFSQFFTKGGGARNFSSFSSFFGGDLGDIFFESSGTRNRNKNTFSFGGNNRFRQKPSPIVHSLPCSLEDLYKGCTRKIKVTRKRVNARGAVEDEVKMLTLDIKRGWKEGTKITFEREGDQLGDGVEAADIVFVVKEKAHARFSRSGNDLTKPLRCSLKKVLSGFVYSLETLDGQKVNVKVPSFSLIPEKGLKHRITGYGMPISKNPNQSGDLILEIAVKLPRLNKEQLQMLE
ncbi:DnaJ subfamily B member 4, partial [Bonamia ostreae]